MPLPRRRCPDRREAAVVRCERMTSPADLVSLSPPNASWIRSYAAILRDTIHRETIRVPVSGTSMRPTIDDGAHVIVAACAPDAVRIGDIVLYEDADHLVCHRVMRRLRGRDGGRLVTEGD